MQKYVMFSGVVFSMVLLTGLQVDGFAQAAQEAGQPDQPPALSRALRDYPLLPPEVNHWPGPEYSDSERGYAMILGMDRTRQGRLWMSWIAGGDSEKGYALLSYSDDDGQSWTQPTTVIDPHIHNMEGLPPWRVLVGNLWTDPLGRLWFFFDYAMGYFDGRGGTWAMICQNPDAVTPTWSAPERIWHGAVLNKPVVISSDEWLLPISLWDTGKIRASVDRSNPGPIGFDTMFPELDPYRGINIFRSTDQGQSWHRIGFCQVENPSFDEPTIVERRDGSLWMLIRTSVGIYETTSTDRGKTWTTPTPAEGIRHTASRHFLTQLKSGNLLLVKHGEQVDRYADGTPTFRRRNARSHLTAFVSTDDGKTWQGGLLLDEREPISYPDGLQSLDGTIYICYDRDRRDEREILMAKFTEADVLAGELVTDGSTLKMLVSKATGEDTEVDR